MTARGATTESPALTFEDVTLGYGRRPAVHHLDGSIASGDLVAIAGPNGAGKSTLLKGIVGEAKPLEGRIRFAAYAAVLTDGNLSQARQLCEAWDENASVCMRGEHAVQKELAIGRAKGARS